MRAWLVSDGECAVFVRAGTATAAKRYWPGIGDDDDLTTTRFSRLDGLGPEREIEVVRIECPHVAEGTIDRDYEDCPYECWDGVDRWEIIDWEATLAALAGLSKR
jgi:hypothetical protein